MTLAANTPDASEPPSPGIGPPPQPLGARPHRLLLSRPRRHSGRRRPAAAFPVRALRRHHARRTRFAAPRRCHRHRRAHASMARVHAGGRLRRNGRRALRLFQGQRFSGHPRHPSVRTEHIALYVGTIASTKLDPSAVKRNRMRRRCREALRITLQKIPSIPITLQLLIAPRSSSLSAPFSELTGDIRTFLSSRSHGRIIQAR